MLEPDAGTVYTEEERKSGKVTPGSCRIIWKRKKYEIKEPEAISADPMETDKFTFVLAAATPEINAQGRPGMPQKKYPGQQCVGPGPV